MLAAHVQSSLDQLLQVVKSADRDKKIHFYYVFECNKADGFIDGLKEPILRFSAEGATTSLQIMDGPSSKYPEISSDSIVTLTIEDMPYEFPQAIKHLCRSCSRGTVFYYRDSGYYSICRGFDRITDLFVKIISRACFNDDKIIAQKLFSLRYPLCHVVLLKNPSVIEHMLANGCQVDSWDSNKKFTALIRAVQCKNLEIVKILIKNGADVDLANYHANLPIAHCDRSHTEISEQSEIIEILLSKSSVLKDMPQPRLLRQLRNAFLYGNKNVVRMLVEYRNDILNMRDSVGQTPLYYLSRNPHSDITELLQGRKIDVNVRNMNGCTPLYTATLCSSGNINNIKFLLKNGTDPNAINEKHFEMVPLFALYLIHKKLQQKQHIEYIELFLEYNLDIQFIGPDQTTIFDRLSTTTDQTFYMAQRFLAHLIILEEKGIPIKQLILNKINSNPTFKDYFDLCRTEFTNIKNNSRSQKISLYMILFNSEEESVKICRSILSSLSQLENLKSQCQSDHAYFVTIEKRISNFTKSTELYQKAKTIICKLLNSGINENHLVASEIANYLDDNDLQTLTEIEFSNRHEITRKII